ncbi:AAA family ATPase [Rhodopila sp.]|uniref:AAA family ATPase n=1 Tax=Rhodopila sp. TaxID=2480087 RepID=UPI003D0BBFF5
MTLHNDQQRAVDEILAARGRGQRHLLVGAAGTGKTYLMQNLARDWRDKKLSVAMTAPTHKAVAVLSSKLRQAGLVEIPCRTIHSLLGLKPKPDGDKLTFVRDRKAEPIDADVVVIDEASMIPAELMAHIRRHMTRAFVLFSGDKAQLPPKEAHFAGPSVMSPTLGNAGETTRGKCNSCFTLLSLVRNKGSFWLAFDHLSLPVVEAQKGDKWRSTVIAMASAVTTDHIPLAAVAYR